MPFDVFYMTDVGDRYLARAVAGGRLRFVRAEMGTGFLPPDASVTAVTGLLEPLQDLPIRGVTASGKTTVVSVQFSNRTEAGGILPPFFWAEIGLFAEIEGEAECPPALCFYANAFEERFADHIKGGLVEFVFNWQVQTRTTVQVSAVIDRSLIYPTYREFEAALAVKPDAHVVAVRERDPGKPDYGLDSGGGVVLRAGPYTGTAEITLQVEEAEYDAENMSAKPQTAPSGTIIIRKVEE